MQNNQSSPNHIIVSSMSTPRFKHLLVSIIAMIAIAESAAAMSPSEVFVNAPRRIFPLIDRNTRLDMLDYFNSGLTTSSKNNLGGGSSVTALSDHQISIKLTDASTVDLVLLPAGTDTLLAVISTVNTPAPDSKLTIYTSDWKTAVTPRTFVKPSLSDWLNSEGKKKAADVARMVPFLLVGYSYDPATATLTLTNNTPRFLSSEVYAIVKPYFRDKLLYRWNNKQFKAEKQ